MCGRYGVWHDLGYLYERFQLRREDIDYTKRYNLAPTDQALVVLDDGAEDGPHGEMVRWGLVPWFMKDPKKGPPMINARAETVATNGAFKGPLARQRCLVIASGFYEWHKGPGPKDKTPMLFQLASGEPFAFAGLWDSWKAPDGQRMRSCTIITTTPNQIMAPVHDRMPVILPRELERVWLDKRLDDPGELQDMLRPYDAAQLRAYAVGPKVNSVRNEGPELIEPVGA